MGFPYGAGGKTLPKPGKLGSGAFYASGHHASLVGNVFGANWDVPDKGVPTTGTPFGAPSQALLSTTGVGRSPNDSTTQQFPRNTIFQTGTYNKLSPLTHARADASGARTGVIQTPGAAQVQLHELTTFVHGRVSIKRATFRVSGGVNNTLKSDTAFQRRPPAQKANPQPRKQSDTSKTAGMNFTGNQYGSGAGVRTLPGSFRVGHNSGSLHGNASNPTVNKINVSASRWSQVKRGAAG